ncbi:MAG: hypothetical protein R3B82_00045 [Sandaracinaceae bacterium]
MSDPDLQRLIAKLRAIEALYSRPGTEGERAAAANARARILDRLRAAERPAVPIEFRFSMPDMWSRRLFVALLRRHGITPYRYRGQRHTTVMAKVQERFVDVTLWPEYQELNATLRAYLDDVTQRVVAQVVHEDLSEAVEVDEPKQLAAAAEEASDETPAPPSPAPDAPPSGARPPKRKKKKRRR